MQNVNFKNIISDAYNINKEYLELTIDGEIKLTKLRQWVTKFVKIGTTLTESEMEWLKSKPIIFNWFESLPVTRQDNWSEYNMVLLATSCVKFNTILKNIKIDIFEDILLLYYENKSIKSYQGWLNKIWVYLTHLLRDDIEEYLYNHQSFPNAYIMSEATFESEDVVNDIIQLLPSRERNILEASFGLNQYDRPYTLKEMSKEFKLTMEYILHKRKKGLDRLRVKLSTSSLGAKYAQYLVEDLKITDKKILSLYK